MDRQLKQWRSWKKLHVYKSELGIQKRWYTKMIMGQTAVSTKQDSFSY